MTLHGSIAVAVHQPDGSGLVHTWIVSTEDAEHIRQSLLDTLGEPYAQSLATPEGVKATSEATSNLPGTVHIFQDPS
jgi:hypothetical protein